MYLREALLALLQKMVEGQENKYKAQLGKKTIIHSPG